MKEIEIRFISLPSAMQLQDQLAPNAPRSIIERYRAQQWRILQAQRKAAVIAAEVLRPNDFRRIKQDFQMVLRDAREKFENQAVAIFSEKCTKGL